MTADIAISRFLVLTGVPPCVETTQRYHNSLPGKTPKPGGVLDSAMGEA
jgi:hypothetical protein